MHALARLLKGPECPLCGANSRNVHRIDSGQCVCHGCWKEIQRDGRRCDSYRSSVAGVTFSNSNGVDRQAVVRWLKRNMELRLYREQGNRYDPNAIAVFWDQYQVGYIPRDTAEWMAEIMDRGAHVEAYVSEVTGGPPGVLNRGVNLLIHVYR